MKKPKRNPAKKAVFEAKYHMTRAQWAEKKRALRAEGKGIEIDRIRRRLIKTL